MWNCESRYFIEKLLNEDNIVNDDNKTFINQKKIMMHFLYKKILIIYIFYTRKILKKI